MKTILAILMVCLLANFTYAQNEAGAATTGKHTRRRPGGTNDAAGAGGAPSPQAAAAANQAQQVQTYQKNFVPTDPWRILNDQTNLARGADWVQFEGKVTQITGGDLMVQGWYGEPLGYMLADKSSSENMTFILSNYPRRVTVGTVFSRNDRLVAMKAAPKDSLPNLDYGKVYVPELTEEQKTQAAQSKTKSDSKVLAFHQELADKGDAYGEYKMGVRYEKGDGVDKDLAKARDLLAKSSAQGNKDATDELAKLPAN